MKKSVVILFLIFTSVFCDKNLSQEKKALKIALIYPHLTKDILYKHDSSFKPTDSWELFFLSNNYKYEMLDEDELGDIPDDINVVVLPSMQVINKDILENIEEMLVSGKGVLITGNFAQYDDDGNYIEPDELKRITGFQISKLSVGGRISVNHSLMANTPLSIGLKPGQKILLRTEPYLYYSYDLSKDNKISGNYLQAGGEFSGMVKYMSSNKRLLWFGFSVDQLIGKNRNQIITNSLNWLSSSPEAFINYWPGKYSSAGIIYKNIENFSDIDNDFPADTGPFKLNYFISPDVLEKLDYYFKNLLSPGNINIIWNDFFFSELSNWEISEWLNKMKSLIHKYSDQVYYGASSYGEFYDSANYKLLNETGYSFIFSSGYSESFSYEYNSTNNIYFFNKSLSPGVDFLSRLDFVLNSGGIGYINIDSVKDNIYGIIKEKICWVTTFSDIFEWIVKRKQLRLSMYPEENNIYEISIENTGSSNIADTGIWISAPDLTGDIKLENSLHSGELTFDFDKKMYFLEVFSLQGYEKASFRISIPM